MGIVRNGSGKNRSPKKQKQITKVAASKRLSDAHQLFFDGKIFAHQLLDSGSREHWRRLEDLSATWQLDSVCVMPNIEALRL